MSSDCAEGLIFDIQGHSVHDGPGCRTLVFLGGCPLRCFWCSNPEGLLATPRLMFRARLCVACPARCIGACPRGAVRPLNPPDTSPAGSPSFSPGTRGLIVIDRPQCAGCTTFDCVKVCYRQALQVGGRTWTAEELLRLLRRDQQYWGPDGGVTFSGGEPLVQRAFLHEVLRACRSAAMHVALETSAHAATLDLLDVLPLVNWLFLDLKHIDSERHHQGTGAGNDLVLQNLNALGARASTWPGRIVVRTTIVPGFNDEPDVATDAARFLAVSGLHEINLLPFHRLGASKYEQWGLAYAAADLEPPGDDRLAELADIYRSFGLACYVGHRTPF
jgi:pyruvate formate lyase activating enzyme